MGPSLRQGNSTVLGAIKMLTFADAFDHHGTDKQKTHGYGPMYSRLFPDESRAKVTAVLEIGVDAGRSLTAWRDLFPNAWIIGIDKVLQKRDWPDRITVIEADATQPFTAVKANRYGPFDLIVDDGSHAIDEQNKTLELFWPTLKSGGVYVIEEFAWYLYGTPGRDSGAQAAVRVKPEE